MALTFKQIQDAVLERFNEGRRADCKEWINYVYRSLWDADEWTFKQTTAQVQITAGSQQVSSLPPDMGVPHGLFNTNGVPLNWLDWRQFQIMHNSESGTGVPYDFTFYGQASFDSQLLVGPTSSETALYTLLYEREPGYLPTTTLQGSVTLPAGTLTVADTGHASNTGGTILLGGVGGRTVNYTGVSGNQLTGCTGGDGVFTAGAVVAYRSPQAGLLFNDTDMPTLPPDFHQLLVFAALAIGQSTENDYSLYLSDDRVQQGLDAMRRRYLVDQRGQLEQWGSYAYGHLNTGGAW